jgi:hypothetical protein
VVHYLGNPPLRAATNRTELAELYYDRYVSHRGNAMSRTTWERSLAVALVQYGVGLFPFFAGMAIKGGQASETAISEIMVERVRRALSALGI